MYTEWALRRGVHVIGSKDRASTLSLIAQADAVVVNGRGAWQASDRAGHVDLPDGGFPGTAYVGDVRARTTTQYAYNPESDGSRLERLLETRHIEADDTTFASDCTEEDRVLQLLHDRRWAELSETTKPIPHTYRSVHRRGVFRYLDAVRERMAIGDR
ncbi:hypothetical protein DL771_011614 [Monosporascus sp. 5C6A]|nr:hypothetical protein DL771_011614 [Monosporascus sp. 5C6A]